MARRFRLLTDEHFPTSLVDALRREGWEVQRVVDVLAPGTPDGEVFAHAAREGLVWVSSDERAQRWPRSYLAEGRAFAGMLVWTQESRYRMRPGDFARQLAALEAEPDPFAWGIRHVRPESVSSRLTGLGSRGSPLLVARKKRAAKNSCMAAREALH